MYKFWLIFFAISINSFCIEPTKRFGCLNLASVDKIAFINSDNNNLLRNLRQCMRDTGTYNEKNLNTAKNFNYDFVQAAEEMSYTDTKFLKDAGLLACIFFSFPVNIFFGSALVILIPPSDNEYNTKLASIAAGAGIVSIVYALFFGHSLIKQKLDMQNATENKWLTAVKIKDFADILQKKNNLTQDIQAARQNK